jgi:hypothetical protein
MTLPYERFRAVDQTREWLLINCHNRKLPKYIREEMRALLRHYPVRCELEAIAEEVPRYLEAVPDPLVLFVNEHQEEVDKDRDI